MRAGGRLPEWECSLCFRRNFLQKGHCRGLNCYKARNVDHDAFVDERGLLQLPWPHYALQLIGACVPMSYAAVARKGAGKGEEGKEGKGKVKGTVVIPAGAAQPPRLPQRNATAKARLRSKKNDTKELQQAKEMLEVAKTAGFPPHIVEELETEVIRCESEQAQQRSQGHSLGQRLDQAKGNLRRANEAAEEALKTKEECEQRLTDAIYEVEEKQAEVAQAHQTLMETLSEAPQPLQDTSQQMQMQMSLAHVSTQLHHLCQVVESAGAVLAP